MAGAFVYLVEGVDYFIALGPSPSILSGVLAFFTLSATIWAPLYTWTVLVMLFWGRDKKTAEIRTLYVLSPILLACAMGVPALLIGIPDSGMLLLWGILHLNHLDFLMPALLENYVGEQSLTVGLVWAFMAALCVVIGYAFVGCVLLIERALQRRGLFIKEEI